MAKDSTTYQTYLACYIHLAELANIDLSWLAETNAAYFWLVEEIKWCTVGTLWEQIAVLQGLLKKTSYSVTDNKDVDKAP